LVIDRVCPRTACADGRHLEFCAEPGGLVLVGVDDSRGFDAAAAPRDHRWDTTGLRSGSRMATYAVLTTVADQPGMLHAVTRVLAAHQANISYVDIVRHRDRDPQIYVEFSTEQPIDPLVAELAAIDGVQSVDPTASFAKIYGKRIVIMGGGAQVGQVALGAIAEADRHNIRGERISVDTIPLVGEQNLAAAVRAVVLLPRVRLLVLAGALMGGDITKAVEEVRAQGLRVISLNMAGSVPDAADLVVSDPVQAGVMAVMAIADTAKFDIVRQEKRKY
jgi:energy-converting hydrogenase B subunit Q